MNYYIKQLENAIPDNNSNDPKRRDKISIIKDAINFITCTQPSSCFNNAFPDQDTPLNYLSFAEKIKIMTESSNGFLMVVSCTTGHILYVTPNVEQITGKSKTSLEKSSILNFSIAEDSEKMKQYLSTPVDNKGDFIFIEDYTGMPCNNEQDMEYHAQNSSFSTVNSSVNGICESSFLSNSHTPKNTADEKLSLHTRRKFHMRVGIDFEQILSASKLNLLKPRELSLLKHSLLNIQCNSETSTKPYLTFYVTGMVLPLKEIVSFEDNSFIVKNLTEGYSPDSPCLVCYAQLQSDKAILSLDHLNLTNSNTTTTTTPAPAKMHNSISSVNTIGNGQMNLNVPMHVNSLNLPSDCFRTDNDSVDKDENIHTMYESYMAKIAEKIDTAIIRNEMSNVESVRTNNHSSLSEHTSSGHYEETYFMKLDNKLQIEYADYKLLTQVLKYTPKEIYGYGFDSIIHSTSLNSYYSVLSIMRANNSTAFSEIVLPSFVSCFGNEKSTKNRSDFLLPHSNKISCNSSFNGCKSPMQKQNRLDQSELFNCKYTNYATELKLKNNLNEELSFGVEIEPIINPSSGELECVLLNLNKELVKI